MTEYLFARIDELNTQLLAVTGDVLFSGNPAVSKVYLSSMQYFRVSAYSSLQAAINAANAAGGGYVYLDVPVTLGTIGSSVVGVSANNTTGVKIVGPLNNIAGVGTQSITYNGTGTAISALGSVGFELRNISLYGPNSAKLIDFATGSNTNSSYPKIVNNTLTGKVGTTILIDLASTIIPQVAENTLQGGLIGIRGVVVTGGIPAGQYVINATIRENIFQSNLGTAIIGLPEATFISNTVEGNVPFYAAGFAGTEISHRFYGNHLTETTALVNSITTGAQTISSIGNTYQPVGGVAITLSGSNQSLSSNSDSFYGSATWAALGASNNAVSFENYNTQIGASATPVVTGTARTTQAVSTIFGSFAVGTAVSVAPVTIKSNANGASSTAAFVLTASDYATNGGLLSLNKDNGLGSAAHLAVADNGTVLPFNIDSGILQLGGTFAGSRAGSLIFVNTTSGSISINPPVGALGTQTITLPSNSGTFALTTDTVANATNVAITNDTTTNSSLFPAFIGANTGNNPVKVSSTKLVFNPSSGNFGIGNVLPQALLHIGAGNDVATLLNGLYVSNNGVSSGAFRDSTNHIELGFFAGSGVTALGSRTNHAFYVQTNSNNVAAFDTSGGFSLGDIAGTGTTGGFRATNFIKSSGATAGIGYAAGAGGAVTQITSRTTGVTLNTVSGAITLVSAAGSASFQTFTFTNSAIAATDIINVNQKSGTDKYQIFVTNIAAGSCQISFATTGGTTTEQPVFSFAIIKGVTS